jgi:GTPase involved in cell partitioning and DNA repair
MNTEFNFLDLGGQEEYRSKHLKNIKKYIKQCNKLIYVIDIQDKERYNLSLDYLEKIMNKVKSLESTLDLSIFFHKYDPNIKDKFPHIQKEINKLLTRIQKIIPTQMPFQVFKTTIYTIFEKDPVIYL